MSKIKLSDKDKEIISSFEEKDEKFIDVYKNARELSKTPEFLNSMQRDDFLKTLIDWTDKLGTSYYVSEEVMDNLSSAIASKNLGADEILIEFNKLKPFKQYNNFIGDLIWRVLKTRDSGVWPKTLPADKINLNDK